LGKKRFLVLCLTCVAIGVGAVALEWDELSSLWTPKQQEAPVIESVTEPESEPESEPGEQSELVMMERFADLYEQNNDLVGWIRVPNTKIDYPVVYCADNAYYLNYDFNKKPSKSGVPFLDKDADLLVKNQSLSIYGHYINGVMFTDLHKYKKLDFYQNSPLFEFDSLYEEGTYKIFSVFYMAGNRSDGFFYYYPFSHFKDNDAFMKHVRQLTVRSIFTIPVDVRPDDQLVLLTCCTYETNNLRLVVAGRKVRPGEEPSVNTDLAQINPTPLYPQKWYDAKGGKPPEFDPLR